MSSNHGWLHQASLALALGAISLALPAACGGSGGGGGSFMACTDGGTCPDGYTCTNGACVYNGGAGGMGGSAGTSSGGSGGTGGNPQDAGPCPLGLSWCASECVDVKKNQSHCGSCNHPCNVGELCSAGQCVPGCTQSSQCPQPGNCNQSTQKCECASGYHLCDYQCVSNDSAAACGSSCTPCPKPDNGIAICDGVSCGAECNPGYHECSGSCASDLSPQSCGTSCTPCPEPPNTIATCDSGYCGFTCASGYHTCSGQCVSNSDPNNCGASCTPCPSAPNGTAACNGTSCLIVCDSGYHKCSGVCVSNTSPQSCGSSCTPCPSSNGTATCTNGVCGLTCNAGYHVCSGYCLSDNSPQSCGSSCTACPTPPNGTATCVAGTCGVSCNAGYHLCSGQCVADSPTNCGPTCSPCPTPPPGAVSLCVNGVCTVSCATGTVPCGTSCCSVTTISAGANHSCLVTSAGGAKCFGYNTYGQLGDGTTTYHSIPTDVSGLTSGVSTIEAGEYNHTCAVTTAGGVKCWGYNTYGQIGDGTSSTKYTPTDVSGLGSGVKDVALGHYHTCALTTSGGVKCWGYNTYGQLGDGTTTSKYTPTDVSGLTSGVIAIAAGFRHTCAVTTAGEAKCWGYNTYGQLGDGTSTTKYVPTTVSTLSSGVSWITAAYYHSCAVVSGAAKCWGYNNYGQIGDGSSSGYKYTPVGVSTLGSGVLAIDATGYHTCAVTGAGAALCWGYNVYGQVGDGSSTSYQYTPVGVSGLSSGVADISAGGSHTCALMSSGGAKCWGYNSYGQVGDGTTITRTTPVDISGQ